MIYSVEPWTKPRKFRLAVHYKELSPKERPGWIIVERTISPSDR
jgi:hypothetical protein